MKRKELISQLRIDEGVRKKMYLDTAIPPRWTVGVGRNISDRAFSDDEIDLMLSNDITIVEKELDRKLPWWRQMNDARQNVLANMAFNMGVPTLESFVNTLKAMQESRYADAAAGMLKSRWAAQVGNRAVRLATVMRTGEL